MGEKVSKKKKGFQTITFVFRLRQSKSFYHVDPMIPSLRDVEDADSMEKKYFLLVAE